MKECDGCRIKHQKIMELNEQIAVQKGMLEDYQKENLELKAKHDEIEQLQKEYAESEKDNEDNPFAAVCDLVKKEARSQGRNDAIAEIERRIEECLKYMESGGYSFWEECAKDIRKVLASMREKKEKVKG